MTPDELDRTLSGEENIVPSTGFVTNVMDAVRRNASTPPPIPFPWKLALPGLAALAAVFVLFLTAAFAHSGPPPATGPSIVVLPAVIAIFEKAERFGMWWIVAALLISFASAKVSKHFIW